MTPSEHITVTTTAVHDFCVHHLHSFSDTLDGLHTPSGLPHRHVHSTLDARAARPHRRHPLYVRPASHLVPSPFLQWCRYNNATRAPLIFRRPSQSSLAPGEPLKMTFFVPQNGFYNATVDQLIAANGGRNNIEVSFKRAFVCAYVECNTHCFFGPHAHSSTPARVVLAHLRCVMLRVDSRTRL